MIPKTIYMCHKNLDNIRFYSLNWKRLNPDYDIKLYDDNLCKEFLLNEYSQEYVDIFNFILDGPIKADFWRICIINKYGGLYVDADIEPLIPLNEFIDSDTDFVTCISFNFYKDKSEFQFNPHFIYSDKNNIILQNCIDKYLELYTNKIKYSYWCWSICKFFNIEEVKLKQSHTLHIDNKKYQFLIEIDDNNCEYDNKIVLHNRYNNYKDHNFLLLNIIS